MDISRPSNALEQLEPTTDAPNETSGNIFWSLGKLRIGVDVLHSGAMLTLLTGKPLAWKASSLSICGLNVGFVACQVGAANADAFTSLIGDLAGAFSVALAFVLI